MMVPDAAGNCEEICARREQRRGIRHGYSANRDAGQGQKHLAPGENFRISGRGACFGCGRMKSAKGDIVSASLARNHRLMLGILAGRANDHVWADQLARLGNIHVIHAEMNPIDLQRPGELGAVIDE